MQNRNSDRLPEVYYQRRRVAAVVVLVVVVLLLVWLLSSLGGNNSDNTAEVATTAAETTPTSSSATSSSHASSSASSSAAESSSAHSSTTSEPQAAGVACQLDQLVMTASTDHSSYAAGELPTFYMALKSNAPADCTINFDQETLRFEVYDLATNQRVWSDVDCNPAVKTGEQVLKAGEEIYFQAKWSRTSSAPQQCSQRPAVPAADYYLHTVVGINASQPATFTLK